MSAKLSALITAGGTREPIDDVRVLTNLSTGRFGAAIANALAERGVAVTLLGSQELLRSRTAIDPAVKRVPFASFHDLARVLAETIAADPPDLLFMAAAVSDYAPVRAEGKIRSDAEELTLRLVRNPKLLTRLREQCGADTFLVGFKLLSGVSREELVSVARAQVAKANLDLSVANDLATFTETEHPVVLVGRDEAVDVVGPRAQVAAGIVEHVLRIKAPGLAGATPPARIVLPPARGELPHLSWDAIEAGSRSLGWPASARVEPVVQGGRAVAALVRAGEGEWVSPFVPSELRGQGVGDLLLERLDWFGWQLAVPASDPQLLAYCVERGYAVATREGELHLLRPPSLRDDLREAASVCVHDPLAKQVLLARRLTEPYLGYWAFPGGTLDEGESSLEAAARELREETGLDLAPLRPEASHTVCVAVGEGTPGYRVTNYLVRTRTALEAKASSEVEPEWLSLEEAVTRRPMAAGTRRVLRAYEDLLTL